MLTLSIQILTCVYLRMKLMKKLNCNLSKERILVADQKF